MSLPCVSLWTVLILWTRTSFNLAAQTTVPHGEPANIIAATQSRDPIQLDGRLDELAWAGANVVAELTQQSPRPGELTPYRTTVRVVLAGDKLNFGFDCTDPD